MKFGLLTVNQPDPSLANVGYLLSWLHEDIIINCKPFITLLQLSQVFSLRFTGLTTQHEQDAHQTNGGVNGLIVITYAGKVCTTWWTNVWMNENVAQQGDNAHVNYTYTWELHPTDCPWFVMWIFQDNDIGIIAFPVHTVAYQGFVCHSTDTESNHGFGWRNSYRSFLTLETKDVESEDCNGGYHPLIALVHRLFGDVVGLRLHLDLHLLITSFLHRFTFQLSVTWQPWWKQVRKRAHEVNGTSKKGGQLLSGRERDTSQKDQYRDDGCKGLSLGGS